MFKITAKTKRSYATIEPIARHRENKLLAIKGSKKPVIVNTVFWHYCC